MHIKVASNAGFCFGVNRAVKAVYELLSNGEKVCTLGPIIHNPQIIEDLSARGVKIVEAPEQAGKDTTLVIRSHGVSDDVMQTIKKLNLKCVDATCPFVKKIHNIVSKADANSEVVLVAGDKTHPEVQGIIGHCGAEARSFNNSDELLDIIKNNPSFSDLKVLVVAQTTFSVTRWQQCLEILKSAYENITIFDTICNTTVSRQNEAEALSKQVDAMIIIGGKNSSNTAKLFSICKENCDSYLIEKFEDLPIEKIKNSKFIGITAGASTPANIIEEVKQKMEDMLKAGQANGGEEMNFEQMLEESLKTLNNDEKVKGIVVGIAPNEVYVDVGRKQAGFIPASELSNDPNAKPEDIVKIGDEIELLIMRTNDQDGTIMLSKKRVDAVNGFNAVIEAHENSTVLTGKVVDVVNGGVLASTSGIKVFIPASLATASKDEPLENLKGQEVQFRIIEVNTKRRRAVGSIRSVLNDARKAEVEKFFDELVIGEVRKGVVKSFTQYGAFIGLGPIDGMVHISELSWDRIKHPSEVLAIGDEVEVTIKGFDRDAKRISLGYKRAEDNPWERLKNDFPIGSIVDATVVGLTEFGAFAKILPGIDGLIHISQISDKRIEKAADALSIGDTVKVMITDVDFDKHRVSLSMKALQEVSRSDMDSLEEEQAQLSEEN